MILTAHGPRLSIAERLAAKNINHCDIIPEQSHAKKLASFIDLHGNLVHDSTIDHRCRIGETLQLICQHARNAQRIDGREYLALCALIEQTV